MRELVIVGMLMGALLLFGLSLALPLNSVFYYGILTLIGGFAFGVPTGVVYHIALYRSLRAKNAVPPGWYWRPIELHTQLTPGDKKRTLPWFYTAASGFLVIVIGLALVISALFRFYLQ